MNQRSLFLGIAAIRQKGLAIARLLPFTALALTPGCASESGDGGASERPLDAVQPPQVEAAIAHLMVLRGALGLDQDHGFWQRGYLIDELGQGHVHVQQAYRGVRVWEGDAIVHLDLDGTPVSVTKALNAGIDLPVSPDLDPAKIEGIAHRDMRPRGAYAKPPEVELVIYPETREVVRPDRLRGPDGELNAVDIERRVTGYALAYHVHSEVENGAEETSHTDHIIDARSGAILKKWSTLFTASATGTGNSQFSGTVALSTNTVSAGYELRDVSRSMSFATYNLNHGTSGTGTIFTDADNTWGSGENYTAGGSTTSANGQTAGVDAHFGTAVTFDYYRNVHGRNGIDNAGTATYNRVHYSSNYDNAFWSDTCFCMTYGDGSSLKVLTSLDVAGHEMSHGVTSRTANLTYSGESGGLNEAFSDIHGTMVEFYARGGSGAVIGGTGGNWTIGEQLMSTPLRYMYKPSLDGASPDAWYSGIGGIDVHYSSGPMNRAFYFLSQGASSSSTSSSYSSYLPGGMTGIGNDSAARIAYRALTVYMSSSTNYAGARTAFLSAASDLYGATSAEYAAVQNAFAAINVGTSAGGGSTGGGSTGGGSTGGTVSEVEPNNSNSTSQVVSTSGATVGGSIASSSDVDVYRVTLGPGRTLTARLTPNTSSDYDLYVYSSNGTQIGSSTNGAGVADQVLVTNTSTTSSFTRYIRVVYYSGLTGTSGSYTLNLTF
jgi:Zn-dependent metalloprotease